MTIIKPPPLQQKRAHKPAPQQELDPQPVSLDLGYRPSGKLAGRVALITSGNLGIGRAVALHYALEGADIAIAYHPAEEADALETELLLKMRTNNLLCRGCWPRSGGVTRAQDMEVSDGHNCLQECTDPQNFFVRKNEPNVLLIPVDLSTETGSHDVIMRVMQHYEHLDILVFNSAVQYLTSNPEDLSVENLKHVFKANVFSVILLVKEALAAGMDIGSSIIITTPMQIHRRQPLPLEYSASNGALTAIVRSLSCMLTECGIRVNGVTSGPIWTPLTACEHPTEKMNIFGRNTIMDRYGMPSDVAPAYVFLASSDASYINGQIIYPNGGVVIDD